MKQDYLWDKTGKDPEIEKLENLLCEFSFSGKKLNEMRSPEMTAEKSAPRKRFVFAFAFASIVAVVIIMFGTLTQVTDDKSAAAIEVPNKFKAESATVLPDDRPKIEVAQIDEIAKTKKASLKHAQKRIVTTKYAPEKAVHKLANEPARAGLVKLTKEEKYAYGQLMLALSITSSKLGLVKDKIAGVETQEVTFKKTDNNRRN